jgi:hypothetical protein
VKEKLLFGYFLIALIRSDDLHRNPLSLCFAFDYEAKDTLSFAPLSVSTDTVATRPVPYNVSIASRTLTEE